jgi:CMP/dCMP kinase
MRNDFMNPPLRVIAIDGPAASGKSSVARAVAQKLGWIFVNTGHMYRAATWAALRDHINVADQAAVAARCPEWRISCSVIGDRSVVQVDGRDIEPELHSPEVNQAVSLISLVPAVREKLVLIQRGLGAQYPVVMEGRDIGTYVFPAAPVKFYIDASINVRARRRSLQGQTDTLEMRDRIDSTRATAPLKVATDAVFIDSSHLDFEQVLSRIMEELGRRGIAGPAEESLTAS